MDQYMGSQKLARYTYLHPGPSGPFLELKNEPMKPPSPGTSALLQHNPSLIDQRAFRLHELFENSSTSNNLIYKPFLTSQNLYFCIPSMTQTDYSPETSGSSTKSTTLQESTPSPISSAGDCTPNVSSCATTPCSSPRVKNVFQDNLSLDANCIKDSPSAFTNGKRESTENHFNGESFNTVVKTEPISTDTLITAIDNKPMPMILTNHTYTSPILHRLLTSPAKTNETSVVQSISEPMNHTENSKSPQYQPRYSPHYADERQVKPVFPSMDTFKKNSKSSQQSRRSPVFARRFPDKIKCKNKTNNAICQYDSATKPTALLSLDTNGMSTDNNVHTDTSPTNNQKRSLDTSAISEQALVKRRQNKSIPITKVQENYCISYPQTIPRCVDCQTANPDDLSSHLAGCRFQNCRTLKYSGDNTYEFEGFTTAANATPQDIESLCTPNTSGQPALNLPNANYIFTRIAKVFCLMFHHEQNQRTAHNEKNIIWKKYMAGWREVCDECYTTLFNHHYMCKQCGYMTCIECYSQLSQLTIEKRKKLKRACTHDDSFSLSEFIPWSVMLKLRNGVVDYLSRLKLDYTLKLYNAAKSEHLSAFLKSLKMKRSHDARDVQKKWLSSDCNNDSNIEFYCNGRLPVFNEWISENAKQFFRKVWSTSCPVLVKQVHKNLSKTLWQPDAFKEHMIDHRETPALWDCETLIPILTNETILTNFWDGFERLNIRLRDEQHNDRPRILKLKDWPTKKDFASVFPVLLHDLMNNIPFSEYTKRSYVYNGVTYHGGALNIVERLPSCLVKPDLGPKLYIAYSQLTSQATKKAGTTNLHIDVSDAVNVLVYVGIGGQGDDGADKEEEIRQVEAEILDSNIDEAQLQRLRNGERPGALWHLFRSDDAKKIREYIGRAHRKAPGSDTIHDQTAYLEKEDLEKLREWSKVESYPVLQFLGDAVFIPSGAPHQVKNLHSCIKIAEDFVSPENLDRCLITTNEFRNLSETHTNHADILQAKNILHYTTRDALNSLIESIKTELSPESSSSSVNN